MNKSSRLQEQKRTIILDGATRRRRTRNYLESLEKDNFQPDPHADLKLEEDFLVTDKKKKHSAEYYQKKYGKTFYAMVEEDFKEAQENNRVSYGDLSAGKSQFPAIRLCDVCGFESTYTCVSCGTKVCQVKCLNTHKATRCVKQTRF